MHCALCTLGESCTASFAIMRSSCLMQFSRMPAVINTAASICNKLRRLYLYRAEIAESQNSGLRYDGTYCVCAYSENHTYCCQLICLLQEEVRRLAAASGAEFLELNDYQRLLLAGTPTSPLDFRRLDDTFRRVYPLDERLPRVIIASNYHADH